MDLVAVARVIKPRGIKGELACEMLTDFPKRFEGLDNVTAVLPGANRELKIEEHWFHSGRLVLKFEGVDSIDDAELLRTADICVPETDSVELEDGEYFDWQLAGCKVETVDGQEIGEVVEMMRPGGTELLVVKGEKEYLIPFATSICTEVDIMEKRIVIDPPEGLLDF
jgi:16S rRNA processing protein RimM